MFLTLKKNERDGIWEGGRFGQEEVKKEMWFLSKYQKKEKREMGERGSAKHLVCRKEKCTKMQIVVSVSKGK